MRYQSTPEKEFDGDIIITDPCYIIRNENGITKNDWHYCEYGEYMERLGIKNYLTHDTIYGDWGCTVFDSDTKKPLGHFCADAGLVSVFLLDEVLAYNPNFNYHSETVDDYDNSRLQRDYSNRSCKRNRYIRKGLRVLESGRNLGRLPRPCCWTWCKQENRQSDKLY